VHKTHGEQWARAFVSRSQPGQQKKFLRRHGAAELGAAPAMPVPPRQGLSSRFSHETSWRIQTTDVQQPIAPVLLAHIALPGAQAA
jgi:hypothetical protein